MLEYHLHLVFFSFRQTIMAHKERSFRQTHGNPGGPPEAALSYKEYLRNTLKRGFWGDDITAHAIALEHKVKKKRNLLIHFTAPMLLPLNQLHLIFLLFQLRITILYAPNLAEKRILHDLPLPKADIVLVFNTVDHFVAAGE